MYTLQSDRHSMDLHVIAGQLHNVKKKYLDFPISCHLFLLLSESSGVVVSLTH